MELQRFPRPSSLILLQYLLIFFATASAHHDPKDHPFIFHGFHDASSALSLNGTAFVHPNGLLQLTNTSYRQIGRAFYQHPIPFARNTRTGSLASSSFSTCFVFAIAREYSEFSGHGLAFTISTSTGLPGTLPNQFLGLFNASTYNQSSTNLFAVELDTIQDTDMQDVDNNHVGIDVKSPISIQSAPAAYYDGTRGENRSLNLLSGDPMKVWIEYDGMRNQLNVTISPLKEPKPKLPLLSSSIDLSSVLIDSMYVGFSSSTGTIASSHYILGWSFKLNGPAEEINVSLLPRLPPARGATKRIRWLLPLALSLAAAALISLAVISGAVHLVRRKKYEELIEDWEQDYGPQRFSYKDLSIATKGFKELLGAGGFGKVYHGILPKSNLQVAVKRVSHDSKQGMKEFIAEIASIGLLRHRNLVQLLGYCRRRGELLLVYDFMPNGSLDKLLYADERKPILDWNRRFRILQGVASALQYLHEEWNQVVVHRDVKASNVLLDADLNGRLGDFGLARLYDHGGNPHTTHVVGTFGYIAPEMARTGKATTCADVFAFGAFMLEVACGRRPILSKGSSSSSSSEEKMLLVEYVWEWWRRGRISGAADPKLGSDYVAEEMELVLKLGLLCSQPVPAARPSMRQVVQFMEGNAVLLQPNLPVEGYDHQQLYVSYASSWEPAGPLNSSSVSEAVLSGGR
ncbi:hypothetical protein ACLOJK_030051 [Asimina triloba]